MQSLCARPEPKNDDVGTTEKTDEDEQSQPDSSDEVNGNDEDEIDTDDAVDNVSESHGLAATASQIIERRPPENCPYTLRKKINPLPGNSKLKVKLYQEDWVM